MWQTIKNYWDTFVASFHNSETILWARLQLVLGAGLVAMQSVDVSLFITDKQMLQYYIFANALITEYVRRRGADFGNPK